MFVFCSFFPTKLLIFILRKGSPPMGTVSINLVQPPQHRVSSTNEASASDTGQHTNGLGRRKVSSATYIPEGIKLPFDLPFDVGVRCQYYPFVAPLVWARSEPPTSGISTFDKQQTYNKCDFVATWNGWPFDNLVNIAVNLEFCIWMICAFLSDALKQIALFGFWRDA